MTWQVLTGIGIILWAILGGIFYDPKDEKTLVPAIVLASILTFAVLLILSGL